MKKISTLFKKDPTDLGRVINEINPENQWVFDGDGIPTRKFDGTSCCIINGEIYKRFDAKPGRIVPEGAIPCQEPDELSGHHPHWLKCSPNKPEDKYFLEALNSHPLVLNGLGLADGTYELCGPKLQGNPEKYDRHVLIRHGCEVLELPSLEFNAIREFLANPENDIEGIVFHHKTDGRMCKIRKCDFGIKR